jgi:Tol biopolymer transport system component
VAVSPDGRHLVFCAVEKTGRRQIWLQPLDSLSARPLAGTEDGSYPFWAPDSRSVAFFGHGELRRVDIAGGPAVAICAAPDGRGGTWGREGSIVFAPSPFGGLSAVSAAGGTARPVTQVDASRLETTHRWPQFLPDGRHFLYFAGSHVSSNRSRNNAVRVASLDSGDSRVLISTRSDAVYSAGHLLYARGTTLLAQRFDPVRLEFSGEPFPVADRVAYDWLLMRSRFSASDDGILAFHGGGASLSRLVWLDRSGKPTATVGAPADYGRPRLSPDGQRLAVEIWDSSGSDIWIQDFARGSMTRFTFSTAEELGPVWSNDSRSLFFEARRPEEQAHDFYVKAVTGSGGERLLASSRILGTMNDWSPDGRFAMLQTFAIGSKTAWDLSLLSVGDGKLSSFRSTPFSETGAQFSPDGRWVAYQSNETGRFELYVQSFPGPGGRWQVSSGGSEFPRWRSDGRELYFVEPGGGLMSAEIKAGEAFEAGTPRPLFQARIKRFFGGAQYDASPDGQRFIVNMSEEDPSLPLTVVLDWPATVPKDRSPR